jgi:hypothetical protein
VLKKLNSNYVPPNKETLSSVYKTRSNIMYLMVERYTKIYPGLCAATRDQRLKRVDQQIVERLSDAV